MTTFLSVCLYVFAACAVLGMVPVAVIAGKERKPAMMVVALVVAAFVAYVLIAAAVYLRR